MKPNSASKLRMSARIAATFQGGLGSEETNEITALESPQIAIFTRFLVAANQHVSLTAKASAKKAEETRTRLATPSMTSRDRSKRTHAEAALELEGMNASSQNENSPRSRRPWSEMHARRAPQNKTAV